MKGEKLDCKSLPFVIPLPLKLDLCVAFTQGEN